MGMYFRNSQVMLITLEHNLILLNKSDTGDAHRIDRGAVLWLTKSKGRKWCKSNPVFFFSFLTFFFLLIQFYTLTFKSA